VDETTAERERRQDEREREIIAALAEVAATPELAEKVIELELELEAMHAARARSGQDGPTGKPTPG
jgi:hypothetical protein